MAKRSIKDVYAKIAQAYQNRNREPSSPMGPNVSRNLFPSGPTPTVGGPAPTLGGPSVSPSTGNVFPLNIPTPQQGPVQQPRQTPGAGASSQQPRQPVITNPYVSHTNAPTINPSYVQGPDGDYSRQQNPTIYNQVQEQQNNQLQARREREASRDQGVRDRIRESRPRSIPWDENAWGPKDQQNQIPWDENAWGPRDQQNQKEGESKMEDIDKEIEEAYVRGFMRKCAQLNINPNALASSRGAFLGATTGGGTAIGALGGAALAPLNALRAGVRAHREEREKEEGGRPRTRALAEALKALMLSPVRGAAYGAAGGLGLGALANHQLNRS